MDAEMIFITVILAIWGSFLLIIGLIVLCACAGLCAKAPHESRMPPLLYTKLRDIGLLDDIDIEIDVRIALSIVKQVWLLDGDWTLYQLFNLTLYIVNAVGRNLRHQTRPRQTGHFIRRFYLKRYRNPSKCPLVHNAGLPVGCIVRTVNLYV
jgi:hypothetical protein